MSFVSPNPSSWGYARWTSRLGRRFRAAPSRRKSFFDVISPLTQLVVSRKRVCIPDVYTRYLHLPPVSKTEWIAGPILTVVILGTACLSIACGIFCGLLLYRPAIQYANDITSIVGSMIMSVDDTGYWNMSGSFSVEFAVYNPSAFPVQTEFSTIYAYIVPQYEAGLDYMTIVGTLEPLSRKQVPVSIRQSLFVTLVGTIRAEKSDLVFAHDETDYDSEEGDTTLKVESPPKSSSDLLLTGIVDPLEDAFRWQCQTGGALLFDVFINHATAQSMAGWSGDVWMRTYPFSIPCIEQVVPLRTKSVIIEHSPAEIEVREL
eukprot:Gregarina_sp_Poly_1__1220@NODE_129_length_13257_cov_57_196588_g115_i0_p7_GENE_NODE_129_length_13257_cov_57_196588_g115_i0NODE_129_length_13257_cov_57_196588_g115_i0_p7_ORF_typecomplete_len318_score25_34Prominin/PF05478_11/0_24_NODE_129_length_13257_cov_57_196588_g115_i063647317